MEKKWIYAIAGSVMVAVLLLVVVVLNVDKSKTKYETYQNYAKQVDIVDWSISEDTAKNFAESNCDKLATGDMPAIKFRNSDHVKSSAAVLAAYCPDSFDNFLAGVIMNNPEYRNTAMYVNERIDVDSR